VIIGGGVAVCSLLSAHRAVIFAIAQLSCFSSRLKLHFFHSVLLIVSVSCLRSDTGHANRSYTYLLTNPVMFAIRSLRSSEVTLRMIA